MTLDIGKACECGWEDVIPCEPLEDVRGKDTSSQKLQWRTHECSAQVVTGVGSFETEKCLCIDFSQNQVRPLKF